MPDAQVLLADGICDLIKFSVSKVAAIQPPRRVMGSKIVNTSRGIVGSVEVIVVATKMI